VLDEQQHHQRRLSGDDATGDDDGVPILRPETRLAEQHGAAWRQPRFVDPPARELSRVERDAFGSIISIGIRDAGSPDRIRRPILPAATPTEDMS
jgi:hypothetical protein